MLLQRNQAAAVESLRIAVDILLKTLENHFRDIWYTYSSGGDNVVTKKRGLAAPETG